MKQHERKGQGVCGNCRCERYNPCGCQLPQGVIRTSGYHITNVKKINLLDRETVHKATKAIVAGLGDTNV